MRSVVNYLKWLCRNSHTADWCWLSTETFLRMFCFRIRLESECEKGFSFFILFYYGAVRRRLIGRREFDVCLFFLRVGWCHCKCIIIHHIILCGWLSYIYGLHLVDHIFFFVYNDSRLKMKWRWWDVLQRLTALTSLWIIIFVASAMRRWSWRWTITFHSTLRPNCHEILASTVFKSRTITTYTFK